MFTFTIKTTDEGHIDKTWQFLEENKIPFEYEFYIEPPEVKAEPPRPAPQPASKLASTTDPYCFNRDGEVVSCSGPLPGGKDITVVQTPEKTLFVEPPRTLAYADYLGALAESTPRSEAEGVYVDHEEKVSKTLEEKWESDADRRLDEITAKVINEEYAKLAPKLDFSGRWRTRGGSLVKVTGWSFEKGWVGYLTDEEGLQGPILWWDEAGVHKYKNDEWTLVEGHREGKGFANA